jgi:hypothetical protein
MMFFEVNLIAVTSGIWEWQVCCERKAIVCGYAATRQLAQLGGHIDLFVLLAEQSRLGSVASAPARYADLETRGRLANPKASIPVSLDRRQAFDCDIKIEISNSWS